MGTKWILRAALLIGAILESQSSASRQQMSKVTTLASPTTSKTSQARKFNTTKKNSWQGTNSDATVTPQYDRPPRLASFSTTLSPTSTIGVYRHAVVHSPHEYFEPTLQHHYASHSIPVTATPANHLSKSQIHHLSSETGVDNQHYPTATTFFKVSHSPGFQDPNYPLVVNHDAYVTHPSANSEITETKAQSRAMIPEFHYQSYNPPTSTLGNYIPPTFAPTLEQNLGKFEPFPPFKYSHTKSLFSELTAPVSAPRSPNLDFGLGTSNFMLKPQTYYSNPNQRGQVPLFSGSGMNTFYTKGVGKALEPYQPLSAQPQLHFNHHLTQQAPPGSQTFGRIKSHGDVANELDINQSGHGSSTQGGRPNPYNAGNFASTPSMPPFRNIEYSFEVPTSSIFNDYDKTFGKYGTKMASGGEKGPVEEEYENSPASHGKDEEKEEKDEKSEYQSEEATSTSREQYNDEGEGESQRNERRGKNARKREENNTEDKYGKNDGFDYEREFEESYKQKLPTEDFEHSEELLDEDDSPKSRKRASSSKAKKASRNHPSTRDREGQLTESCLEFPSFVRNDDDTESSKSGKKSALPPKSPSFGRKMPRRRPTRFTSLESEPVEIPQKSKDSQNRKNPVPSSNKKNSSH
ncbi:uncharacterized protein LOC135162264 [Diachasmimorpha longicaudata]|uniref:uncharacterized protein LOC135162264 n=1 Tax=Diachasmimorpha longicaudata TaxID=58733 RepID=UPI0030B894B5